MKLTNYRLKKLNFQFFMQMKKNPGYFLKNWGLVESNENQKIFKSKSVSIFMKNVRIK